MDTVIDFITANYIWFIIGAIVLVLSLIGYYAEKNNLLKNMKKNDTEKTKTTDVKNEGGSNIAVAELEPKKDFENELADKAMAMDFLDEDIDANDLYQEKVKDTVVSNEPLVVADQENLTEEKSDIVFENIEPSKVPEIEPNTINNEIDNTQYVDENNALENPVSEEIVEPSKVPEIEPSAINNEIDNTQYVDENTALENPVSEEIVEPSKVPEIEPSAINNEIDNTQYVTDEMVSEQYVNDDFTSMNSFAEENETVYDEYQEPVIEQVSSESQFVEESEEEITDEEILSQTRDLDAIREELNKIVFDTNLDEKYLKNFNVNDDLNDINIKLPNIDTLRLERNKKDINNEDIWNS